MDVFSVSGMFDKFRTKKIYAIEVDDPQQCASNMYFEQSSNYKAFSIEDYGFVFKVSSDKPITNSRVPDALYDGDYIIWTSQDSEGAANKLAEQFNHS